METQRQDVRRQEERSAATRTRLLEGTFECLVELGYARTSTPEILRRCGLSRGAMLHHYPTRADLVAAAVDYVLQRQLDEFEVAFTALPGGADRAAWAIEQLWASFSGPSHYAWLELVMASRTDPALRDRVREVITHFDEGVRRLYRDIFPRSGTVDPIYRRSPQFAFAVLTGLSIARIYEDEDRIEKGVGSLKQLATLVDGVYRGGAVGTAGHGSAKDD